MTTKPVPSADPQDLLDNARRLDQALNTSDNWYYDRFGVPHLTPAGAIARYASTNNRGAWVTATAYAVQDIVLQAGTWYICVVAHTSSAAFATDLASKWRIHQGVIIDQLSDLVDARVDFGAKVDGATNDLTAINAALAAPHQQVFLQEGKCIVNSEPTNVYGPHIGPGALLKPITGGYQQINSYADQHKYFIGKEYLYRVWQRMIVTPDTPIKAFVYGDSTVAGGYVSNTLLEVQNLFPAAAAALGIRNELQMTNRGVAGTFMYDMNALPDLGSTTDLFIIKYGINDGTVADATRLSDFTTNLRGKLAAIRAATNGDFGNLSIVLVGPNSTSDTPNARDERWYEQLRGVYLKAARDYKCAYFDAYAYMRDSRGMAGYGWDNAFGDGRGIHLRDQPHGALWGGLFDWMFGGAEILPYKTNRFVSQSTTVKNPLAADLPNTYPYGISVYRATLANGWGVDGMVLTIRQADNVIVQWNLPYLSGSSAGQRRVGYAPGNTWNRWTGKREALTLAGTWVNYSAGVATTDYVQANASLDEAGFVTIEGQIKSGTATAGSALGTLPAGMRPSGLMIFPVVCGTSMNTFASVRVQPDGQIIAASAVDTNATSLSGITFRAA